MSSPFLAEIRMFGGNYAPRGWAFCNGQLLPLSQNTALFSLLGTNYGGDGKSTFALPDLQGRAPLGAGQGPGLTSYAIGATGGAASVTLNSTQMPPHGHTPTCFSTVPNAAPLLSPAGNVWAVVGSRRTTVNLYSTTTTTTPLNPAAVQQIGGSQPHNNLPPYQCVSFIIAMQGIFPPRP